MKYKNHRRVMKIGDKLVNGPSAIFRISDGDWLESDLTIILNKGYKEYQTYSIFTEDTMNKDDDFLFPMVRVLKWEKIKDLEELQSENTRKFPNVILELGTINKEYFEQVNETFINFQKIVLELNQYKPFKISTKRDGLESNVDFNEDYIRFKVFFRNGNQSFEFSSEANTSDKLVKEILKFTSLLQNSLLPVDKSNWKERYYELTEEYLEGEIPEWHYKNEIVNKA